jgi:hypothetical protein
VKVDAQGRFGVRADLPASGEKTFTIISSAPPLAPRVYRSKVTRVASIDDAARQLDARSPLAFAAFSADPARSRGKLVVVDGDIVEARAALGHVILLVEEKKACTQSDACIVRVIHGDDITVTRGDAVRAYGVLQGTVSNGGKTVPDVKGALVVVRPGAKK